MVHHHRGIGTPEADGFIRRFCQLHLDWLSSAYKLSDYLPCCNQNFPNFYHPITFIS